MSELICITGVSSGIGHHAARYLMDHGYKVIGTVRKEADAAQLHIDYPDQFHSCIVDVRSDADVEKMAKRVEELTQDRGLKALVNNAGIVVAGPLIHIESEELKDQLDINVIGVHRATKALIGSLKKHGDARIINLSSVSGILANAFLGPYCASKFALEAYSDSLRRELMLYPIKVIVLQPGTVQSKIWSKQIGIAKKYFDTDYGDIIKLADKMIARYEETAIPALLVSKKLKEAIEVESPKTRYLIAKKSWRYKVFSTIVPDKWIDKMYKRYAVERSDSAASS